MQLLPNIYICFPEGKHKVLTMSYDDGKLADRKLVSIFNQYGIKGSFHLNSGLPKTDQSRIPTAEYLSLYQGHEISCHTQTHPTIARSPIEQVVQQVIEDRKFLEKITEKPVCGLSYPNGSYSKEIIQMLPYVGIKYSRTTHSTKNFQIPADFLEWKPTCHHNNDLLTLGQEFLSLKKQQYLYMMYVWGHSYEFDSDCNWDMIENFCSMMSSQSDIWYATNIEIVNYIDDAKRLQFTMAGTVVYNPSFRSIWIQHDEKIIEIFGGATLQLSE